VSQNLVESCLICGCFRSFQNLRPIWAVLMLGKGMVNFRTFSTLSCVRLSPVSPCCQEYNPLSNQNAQ
jgi:hypothetical protein